MTRSENIRWLRSRRSAAPRNYASAYVHAQNGMADSWLGSSGGEQWALETQQSPIRRTRVRVFASLIGLCCVSSANSRARTSTRHARALANTI
eukprot:227456-Pyramimonas_sp.AAC.2